MNAGRQPGGLLRSWFVALLLFFSLWTFAVAQSIYSMLVANPNFLEVRLSGNSQLLGIVAVFNLLPPLLLSLAWLLARQLGEQLGRGFLGIVAAGLLLLLFWQAQNLYLGEWWHSLSRSYLFWLLPAGLLGLALARSPKGARAFALVAAPLMLLLPVVFLARTWSIHQESARQSGQNLQQALSRAASLERPAVFFLIFDELSLPVLLDTGGGIDAAAFPRFAELARHSYWFRQATANADFTNNSLPTMLTGNFPRRAGLTQQALPENIFALLEPHYELFLYETWSKFCLPQRYHCLRDSDRLEAGHAALFLDVFYLFAARAVPRGARLPLPDVRKNWGFFFNPRLIIDLALRRYERFLEALSALDPSSGVFVFFHNSLPHSPYWVKPDGKVVEEESAAFDPAQRGDAAQVDAVFARYSDQVAFVDSQLGRFLDLLKQRNLFDASLLIVTSDHGVSYDPRAPGRDLVVEDGLALNAEQLLRVPLLIKRPHQKEGLVSDREVQLIDIMPTVADVVGLEVPWAQEGRSVFSPAAPPRNRVAYDRSRHRYEFPGDPRQGWRVLTPDPRRPERAEQPR